MTRYSFYRRVKMSHPLLLFCADRIALFLEYQALRRIQTLGIQFALQILLSGEYLATPRLPRKHLTLTSFGCGDSSLVPILGEPREQSKEFAPFPNQKTK